MKTFIYLCLLCIVIAAVGSMSVRANIDTVMESFDEDKFSGDSITTYFGEKYIMDVELYTEGLLEELKPHYYYNMSNQNQALTREELLEQGGVCWHYANYYVEKAKEDGYDAIKVTMPLGEIFHATAVISSEEGYCVIDQNVIIGCQELESQDEDE